MNSPSNPRAQQLDPLLAETIASIRYGAVEGIIHDGRIVQIEKREKLRPVDATETVRGTSPR